MKIPALLYGRAATVRTRTRKLAKTLIATDDFEHFDPGEYLDTGSTSGILLMSPEHIISPEDNFHCYALSLALFETAGYARVASVMKRWMLASWDHAWRFAGVLGDITSGHPLSFDRSLHRPYVEVAAKHWPELSAEGRRFGPFVNAPEGLWEHSRNLQYALANLGIPNDDLQQLPAGGLAEYLRRIDKGAVEA